MTRSEYLEILRRNRFGNEYGNTIPSRSLPMPEEREFVPEEYERFMPYRGREGRRLRFPDDRIPSSMPEEGLDYGRPYNSLRRRSYPEYRTMEFRHGRDDIRRGGYEQPLPYYPGRDAAPRQRTLEYDFDRDYDPYGYEELL